jgi:hypothetical protein
VEVLHTMSYELLLPIQAEEIWSDERLNKDDFYAAMYFLRHQENQQKPGKKLRRR